MAKILLLEADRQLASYMSNLFKWKGYDVSRFSDPQAAITSTDAQLPDVVVLNLSLAGRSGIEFLFELRSYPDWHSVPAIVIGRLSPEEQTAYAQAFSQLNVASYVPVAGASPVSLAQAIADLQPAQV